MYEECNNWDEMHRKETRKNEEYRLIISHNFRLFPIIRFGLKSFKISNNFFLTILRFKTILIVSERINLLDA